MVQKVFGELVRCLVDVLGGYGPIFFKRWHYLFLLNSSFVKEFIFLKPPAMPTQCRRIRPRHEGGGGLGGAGGAGSFVLGIISHIA